MEDFDCAYKEEVPDEEINMMQMVKVMKMGPGTVKRLTFFIMIHFMVNASKSMA